VAEPVTAEELAEPDLQSVLQLDLPPIEAAHIEPPHPVTAPGRDAPVETSTAEPPPEAGDAGGSKPLRANHRLMSRPSPDEPAAPPEQELPPAPVDVSAPAIVPEPVKAPSWLDEPLPNTRRLPLRFMWQMDHEGRFSLGSDEFTRLIGTRTAAGFGRLWSDIAAAFASTRMAG